MALWNDLIKNHPVHQEIRDLAELLEQVDGALDEKGEEQLRRLRSVTTRAAQVLEGGDAEIVSPQMLDVVSNHVANVISAVTQFQNSPQAAYLDQASVHLDELLGSLASFPSLPQDKLVKAVIDQAKRFKTDADMMLKELRSQAKEVREEEAKLRESISIGASENGRQLKALSSHVEQLMATIDQQTTRLDTALSDFSNRTANALTELQTTFTNAENARIEEMKATESKALDALREQGDSAMARFNEKGEAAIAGLEQLQSQAEELVGVVTSTATAGYFKGVADEEKATADRWRRSAVVLSLTVVVLGAWSIRSVTGTASSGHNLRRKHFSRYRSELSPRTRAHNRQATVAWSGRLGTANSSSRLWSRSCSHSTTTSKAEYARSLQGTFSALGPRRSRRMGMR
ncbi:MAG: hypothetical protein M3404_01640 [Actinomycetota bacterium]|nr:hypothetical protein [Actinomycetota bacterium]